MDRVHTETESAFCMDTLSKLGIDVPAEPRLSQRWGIWRQYWKQDSVTTLTLLEIPPTWEALWERLAVNAATTMSSCTLHLFRDGVAPQYEDPHNNCGGHFKLRAQTADSAHNLWMFITANVLLERMPRHTDVCGWSLRKKVRSTQFQLWISDSRDDVLVRQTQSWLQNFTSAWYVNCKFCPHKYILATLSQKTKRLARRPPPLVSPGRIDESISQVSPTASAPCSFLHGPMSPYQYGGMSPSTRCYPERHHHHHHQHCHQPQHYPLHYSSSYPPLSHQQLQLHQHQHHQLQIHHQIHQLQHQELPHELEQAEHVCQEMHQQQQCYCCFRRFCASSVPSPVADSIEEVCTRRASAPTLYSSGLLPSSRSAPTPQPLPPVCTSSSLSSLDAEFESSPLAPAERFSEVKESAGEPVTGPRCTYSHDPYSFGGWTVHIMG
eukprot:NODE_486_length_2192_cov_100.983201_g446_i0.p1 GENE.NODE_486_length_2192_cov_100.983201_g446_i0~~NODE_486_length_2192_cov_100.983201_g446_i0.p1  ORF type:complete len:437 (-),score=71.89 NODE_486_length_2192_cov_100.983201_g446_i0:793-2103(-)